MAQIVIRRLDDDVKARLQQRARQNGRSAEAEVREILRATLLDDVSARVKLGSRIASRFSDEGLDQPIAELHGQSVTATTFES